RSELLGRPERGALGRRAADRKRSAWRRERRRADGWKALAVPAVAREPPSCAIERHAKHVARLMRAIHILLELRPVFIDQKGTTRDLGVIGLVRAAMFVAEAGGLAARRAAPRRKIGAHLR